MPTPSRVVRLRTRPEGYSASKCRSNLQIALPGLFLQPRHHLAIGHRPIADAGDAEFRQPPARRATWASAMMFTGNAMSLHNLWIGLFVAEAGREEAAGAGLLMRRARSIALSSKAGLCSSGLALRKMSVRALMKAGMPEASTRLPDGFYPRHLGRDVVEAAGADDLVLEIEADGARLQRARHRGGHCAAGATP